MENYDYANSYKVTYQPDHGVDCDPNKRTSNASEYIRQYIKSFGLAVYQLAFVNAYASSAIKREELWVHVNLKIEILFVPTPVSIQ